ncbi:pentapeptide repeat-containing protein [Methanolobus sp. ZRKC3]|uniref:pentapeptide repeat-containing protein n=1 Tax=Methanolobus sp. ZRKC3 TaxID=3125786 RepID=UPI0032558408
MISRNLVAGILFLVIVFFAMSTVCQAQEYTQVEANDILKQIENREDVHLENSWIIGTLDLSGISVESEIKIVSSVFENDVDFSNTKFSGKTDFEGATFNDSAYFEGAAFNGSAVFREATFSRDAEFIGATFNSSADFGEATFSRDAEFIGATFNSHVGFGKATFSHYADFNRTTFSRYVGFRWATFNSDAGFSEVTFNRSVDFTGAAFNGDADFSETTFNGDTTFLGAILYGVADFSGANFSTADTYALRKAILFRTSSVSQAQELTNVSSYVILTQIKNGTDVYYQNSRITGTLDLSGIPVVESKIVIENSIFEKDVDFSYTQFRKPLSFSGTEFSDKIDFTDATFNGDVYFLGATFNGVVQFYGVTVSRRVDFIGATFNGVMYGWSFLKDAPDLDGPTYIKLMNNFRDNQQFDEADDAYYQYRLLRIGSLTDIFMWLTCGFGVKPYRAIIFGGLIVLLFSHVYWRGDGISRLKEDNGDDNQHISFFDAFYFSMVTFTTVGYGDWYPKDRYRKYVMIEGLLGWLILALFLVTLANVMIRP